MVFQKVREAMQEDGIERTGAYDLILSPRRTAIKKKSERSVEIS
jgi:hypothetical protein